MIAQDIILSDFAASLGPSAIAGTCVLLILLGRLIPRKNYNDLLRALELKDKQIEEKDKQLALALEVGRNVQDVMNAIHRLARKGDES